MMTIMLLTIIALIFCFFVLDDIIRKKNLDVTNPKLVQAIDCAFLLVAVVSAVFIFSYK